MNTVPRSKMLKQRRGWLCMTQQQVADKAEITLGQYQKFELGSRDIFNASFELACRVIEALDMDVADFFHGSISGGRT